MESRYEIIRKLLKIQELEKRGEEEERKVAESKLNQLLDKYKISRQELENNTESAKQMYWFKHYTKPSYSKELLGQVVFAVTGDSGIYTNKSRSHQLGVNCSNAQALEIEARYEFYYNTMCKDLEIFYSAYLHKNNIFPIKEIDHGVADTASRKQTIDVEAMRRMASGMNRHDYHKQLE